MDYDDYVTKEELIRREKQDACSHPRLRISALCRECGKVTTIEVQQINSVAILLEQSLFHCSYVTTCIDLTEQPIEHTYSEHSEE